MDYFFVGSWNSIIGWNESVLDQINENSTHMAIPFCIINNSIDFDCLSLEANVSCISYLLLSKLASIESSPYAKQPQVTGLVELDPW